MDRRSKDLRQLVVRMIEVKGRSKVANHVTVSRNEIMACLNKPDDFRLAIVRVDDGNAKKPNLQPPAPHHLLKPVLTMVPSG